MPALRRAARGERGRWEAGQDVSTSPVRSSPDETLFAVLAYRARRTTAPVCAILMAMVVIMGHWTL
jgi:hypothetical protein